MDDLKSQEHKPNASDLPLLTTVEDRQLAINGNWSPSHYPQSTFVQDLFDTQVRLRPDAIAVAYSEKALSYEELNRYANQLANYLQELGVGPDTLVGVFLEPSFDLMVSIIAILKAGGAYVPLDPAYPSDRLNFMLEDACVHVLLTHDHLVNTLTSHTTNVIIRLDLEGSKIRQKSDGTSRPVSRVDADNLAYVIYTSGSTGWPKGVQITHRGLLNYTVAISKAFKHQPTDRMLQLASISFDVAVEETFPLWLSGATVVLCNRQQLMSPRELRGIIEQEQLTVCVLLTSYWHEWLRYLIHLGTDVPNSMRCVIIGGERVLPEFLLAWFKFNVPLINVYGLTEVTVTSSVYEINEAAAQVHSEVPIGCPISNTDFYVLDRYMQVVPTGVSGELYIGGDGLARGYLNQVELTAEKFVPHPFSKKLGARLYRTGDVVRYRNDGDIEFLGRSDNQVKLRGYRIELGEVEVVLSRHPSIEQCVVVVREDEPGDKRLAAYIVAAKGEQIPTVGELRHFLHNVLPDHMIPLVFVLLERLPLTFNAKIDHTALPQPKSANALGFDETFVAPRSSLEEVLAWIYADVLDIERVGVYDNFFELGGHSLLAVSIVSQLEDIFRMNLSLQIFFEKPTIADMVEYLKASGEVEGRDIPRVAQILRQLNEFSDDEVEIALEKRRTASLEG